MLNNYAKAIVLCFSFVLFLSACSSEQVIPVERKLLLGQWQVKSTDGDETGTYHYHGDGTVIASMSFNDEGTIHTVNGKGLWELGDSNLIKITVTESDNVEIAEVNSVILQKVTFLDATQLKYSDTSGDTDYEAVRISDKL